jgi:N-acetylmuramoyl-L-alanine amidase
MRALSVVGATTVLVLALIAGAFALDRWQRPDGSPRADPTPENTILTTEVGGADTSSASASPSTNVLKGKLIVIDPGHRLGNRNYPTEVNEMVPAGGFEKICNTTGTATNDGYPEATFTYDVALRLAKALRHSGAHVVLTRRDNSDSKWGPCVDTRGRAGNKIHADLKVSIHADGSWSGHGFHVIAPALKAGYTDDVYAVSKRLAVDLRDAMVAAGFDRSTYRGGGDGLVFRSDLGTLNLSNIPVAMVECGNMRDAHEAKIMESKRGRQRYAVALLQGIREFVVSQSAR